MATVKLLKGNNIDLLKTLPANSIHSVVTDGPYGLKFMNKKWDYQVPSVEFWKEVYRVLKPGGHVLSFGGTRTYHRMVVNLEDGGFEIRDCISWLYGSGFPKSHNIGKAVDKIEGNEWEGWGTALKPAQELICMARKPLTEKTIAKNVLKHKTGGINIDGCRVGSETISSGKSKVVGGGQLNLENTRVDIEETFKEGRFPANVILDEEAGKLLDQQSGESKTTPNNNYKHNKIDSDSEIFKGRGTYTPRSDKGGASRFFYSAKVSKKERNEGLDEKNIHPTCKPIKLMAYLCRLITPPNGIVLDPFMGSGSTGIAALQEGFRFLGMELEEEYFNIAEARINNKLK